MSEAPVLIARAGGVATVTLSRPGRRNGVTTAMCRELHAALVGLAASDAQVVVLRGAGEDFSVGADLGGPAGEERPERAELMPLYHAATLLHTMPQVTIAAIDGGCAGAALGWAAACDFRFATPEARFATAFLRLGLSGDMGLPWTLPRLVGPALARELLLLPDKLTGTDALEIGLVTRLFGRSDLLAETQAVAERLAATDSAALRAMKANLLDAEAMDLSGYIDCESERHLDLAGPGLSERLAQGLPRSAGSG